MFARGVYNCSLFHKSESGASHGCNLDDYKVRGVEQGHWVCIKPDTFSDTAFSGIYTTLIMVIKL